MPAYRHSSLSSIHTTFSFSNSHVLAILVLGVCLQPWGHTWKNVRGPAHPLALQTLPMKWDLAGGWPPWDPLKPRALVPVSKGDAADHFQTLPSWDFWQRIPTVHISASPLFAKPRGLPALCFLVTLSPLGLMCSGGSSKVGFPGGGSKEGGSGEKPADRQPRASSTLPGASWGGWSHGQHPVIAGMWEGN